jgi:hypothetical protein
VEHQSAWFITAMTLGFDRAAAESINSSRMPKNIDFLFFIVFSLKGS